MFTKQLPLLSNSDGKRSLFGFMQAQEDAFAVMGDSRLPFTCGFMWMHTNNSALRIALSTAAVHSVLLMRHFAQVFDAVVCTHTVDVVDLVLARIFFGAQSPNQAMRQVTSVADAHADMTAALSDAPCNSSWLDAALRCFANQQTIAHFKKAMQFRNWRQRLSLGCHLRFSEVATGQGVGAPLPFNFTWLEAL